jgi:hypothetical protein
MGEKVLGGISSKGTVREQPIVRFWAKAKPAVVSDVFGANQHPNFSMGLTMVLTVISGRLAKSAMISVCM